MSEMQQLTYPEETLQPMLKQDLLSLARKIQVNASNGHPVALEDLTGYINSLNQITRKMGGAAKALAEEVREWVLTTKGNFLTTDVYRDMNLTTRDHKKAVVMALLRLEQEGLVAKTGTKRGSYRIVDQSAEKLDWFEADISQTYNLTWPFSLEKLMLLYPKNIVVIAGDSNTGKTAFLLNLAKDNCDKYQVDYFTNELGPEELKKRLTPFQSSGVSLEAFKKVNFRTRTSDYLDVIHPDHLSIIDYLMLTKDFWLVAEELDKIFNKLNKGLAVVAIQKKEGQKLGRGGDFALERPRLYLTMSKGRMVIVKAKNWADRRVDPNGKIFLFNLWEGCRFVQKGGYQAERQPGEEG